LGALIDAGAPQGRIREGLLRLSLPAWRWRVWRARRGQFMGTRVEVRQVARGRISLQRVMRNAARSSLPPAVKEKGEMALKRLLAAEGKVHGVRAVHAHLHELEDLDTAVDVYGSLLAIAFLGVKMVYCSPVNVGSGHVVTAHGTIPVPAPGTAELLRGREIKLGRGRGELTTPTGAALLSTVCSWGPVPIFSLEKIGYGAGSRNTAEFSNVLRILVGETNEIIKSEDICQVECVVDDMSPQLVQAFLARAYREGAREAWSGNVSMKKQRPGIALYVLVKEDNLERILSAFFEETGTLGVRITRPQRVCLERRIIRLKTRWGLIRTKLAGTGSAFHAVPEYDDIRRLAAKAAVPVRLVMEEAKGLLAARYPPRRPPRA
jgi:uncharacterized protein (TIGR00299 family) protein